MAARSPKPFLGILDGFDAVAANIAYFVPVGGPNEPGASWNFAWVRAGEPGAQIFRPFMAPEHCPVGRATKLADFGVTIGHIPTNSEIFVRAPALERFGRATRIDGAPWKWTPGVGPGLDTVKVEPKLFHAVLKAARDVNQAAADAMAGAAR